MKKCKCCKKEINKKEKICPYCNKKQVSKGQIIVAFVIIFIALLLFAIDLSSEEDISYDQYEALNPQELHSDYISNEISAKEKYSGNYYYFTGKIFKIEEYLGDRYLEIRYTYSNDTSKIIELDAYFKNDTIKELSKDQEVTVYCKFKQRNLENYMGTITTYSFKNCKIKND